MHSMPHNKQEKPERLLTAAEAAEILSVSSAYVYQLMSKGLLSHVQIGRSRRLKVSHLLEFIECQTRKSRRD
jgi:excisionase family DNA binding protein